MGKLVSFSCDLLLCHTIRWMMCGIQTAIVSSMLFSMSSARGGDVTAVPRLTGEKVAIVVQLARLRDLEFRSGVYLIAPQHWREELQTGVVYLQTPQPGTSVPKGSSVTGWTFARAMDDAEILQVPDFRGQSFELAVTEATAKGFQLIMPPAREGAGPRRVVDQFPAAGSRTYQGTSLLLTTLPVDVGTNATGTTPPPSDPADLENAPIP